MEEEAENDEEDEEEEQERRWRRAAKLKKTKKEEHAERGGSSAYRYIHRHTCVLLIPRRTGTSAANRVYRHAKTAKRNEAAVAAGSAAVAAAAGPARNRDGLRGSNAKPAGRGGRRDAAGCGGGGNGSSGGESETGRGTEKRCVCSDRRNGRGGGENKRAGTSVLPSRRVPLSTSSPLRPFSFGPLSPSLSVRPPPCLVLLGRARRERLKREKGGVGIKRGKKESRR